ncbi:hypothetical protein DdX_15725 [Ditylenchus destructor]|uniref:Uncharacterized protein n=1 Tax=Ditylenchus destructor TaxID=166010 RepID=A0AAD4MUU4_9BILA|nr:hypothetical protein DdX_15725 [Ditylenchus destructor]
MLLEPSRSFEKKNLLFRFHPLITSQSSPVERYNDGILRRRNKIQSRELASIPAFCPPSRRSVHLHSLNGTGLSKRSLKLSNVILNFVRKFVDLKMFDESQIVQSIKSNYAHDVIQALYDRYAECIVEEEENDEEERAVTIFEFVNSDIGKKMQLTLETTDCDNEDIKTCLWLEIENL